jgi:hypothetical protein
LKVKERREKNLFIDQSFLQYRSNLTLGGSTSYRQHQDVLRWSHELFRRTKETKRVKKSVHLPPKTTSRCELTMLTSRASPTKPSAAIERKRTDLRSTYDDKKRKQKKKRKKKKKKKKNSTRAIPDRTTDQVAKNASTFPKAVPVHNV